MTPTIARFLRWLRAPHPIQLDITNMVRIYRMAEGESPGTGVVSSVLKLPDGSKVVVMMCSAKRWKSLENTLGPVDPRAERLQVDPEPERGQGCGW